MRCCPSSLASLLSLLFLAGCVSYTPANDPLTADDVHGVRFAEEHYAPAPQPDPLPAAQDYESGDERTVQRWWSISPMTADQRDVWLDWPSLSYDPQPVVSVEVAQ